MASDNPNSSRDIFDNVLIIISGIIFGIGAIFVKLAIVQPDIISIILYPVSWLAAFCAVIGFLIMQRAMHDEHVTIVVPMITGISTLISVMLAYAVLSEAVSMSRWIGVFLILIGSIAICMVKK